MFLAALMVITGVPFKIFLKYGWLNNELEGRPDKGALKFLDFE